MQEDFRLIADLVTVLVAAAAGGLLASWLRQPILLGYLVAGMVVGPAGLGWVKELVQVETLAQIGVAFLLFALGVEFSFAELRKVQKISLGGGGIQIALTILVTALISVGVGWVSLPSQGVFLGAILALSSTAVVLKSLTERNETETPHGQVMLGILIVQDLAVGLMLAVLPALDKPLNEIGISIGLALLQIGLFAAGAIAAGIWVIPPLLKLLARTESREIFLLGVVALCLVIAIFTDYLGLSIEMGAFVAGLMISDVEYADQTLNYVEPLRDIFATLFFASIGMLIDPFFLWQNIELILGLVTLVLIGKILIITPIVRAFGYSLKTALIAGIGLAQIGEFSFVLASEGQSLGLVSRRVYLLILGTTAVTLVLTPFLLRSLPTLFNWLETNPQWKSWLELDQPMDASEHVPSQNHIVVCSYGRTGQNIVKLMQSYQRPVVVIDQSEANVQKLREAGIPYIYGSPSSPIVLEAAMVGQASGMVITCADPMISRLTLKRALELSPDLDVVVRASRNSDIEVFYQLGAKAVVQPEFEASLELATHLLVGQEIPLPVLQQEMSEIRSSHYLALRPEQSSQDISKVVEAAAETMHGKWYVLPEHSALQGMTLEESDLRRLTGVSVLAIRRAHHTDIEYPDTSTPLEAGDHLLLVGDPKELAALDELVQGKQAFPEEDASCQWLSVPTHSLIASQNLSQLDIRRRFGVQVQAIRRRSDFIRFPTGDTEVQSGDRLLLCGSYTALCELEEWIYESLSPEIHAESAAAIAMPGTINSANDEENLSILHH